MKIRRNCYGNAKSEKGMDVHGLREEGDPLCIRRKAAAWQVSTEKGRQAAFVDGESEDVGWGRKKTAHGDYHMECTQSLWKYSFWFFQMPELMEHGE